MRITVQIEIFHTLLQRLVQTGLVLQSLAEGLIDGLGAQEVDELRQV
jgi:hypothetical protein